MAAYSNEPMPGGAKKQSAIMYSFHHVGKPMRRTQIQLDEATYELLRQKAHQRRVSLARLVREAVAQYLTGKPKPRLKLSDFKWIGIGSDPEPGRSVAEDHDAVLGDLLYEEIREKADELRRLEEERRRANDPS